MVKSSGNGLGAEESGAKSVLVRCGFLLEWFRNGAEGATFSVVDFSAKQNSFYSTKKPLLV